MTFIILSDLRVTDKWGEQRTNSSHPHMGWTRILIHIAINYRIIDCSNTRKNPPFGQDENAVFNEWCYRICLQTFEIYHARGCLSQLSAVPNGHCRKNARQEWVC